MSSKWKSPGDARPRFTRAKMISHRETTFTPAQYSTRSDLQTRRLRQRFGLDENRARLLAALCFGEGR